MGKNHIIKVVGKQEAFKIIDVLSLHPGNGSAFLEIKNHEDFIDAAVLFKMEYIFRKDSQLFMVLENEVWVHNQNKKK